MWMLQFLQSFPIVDHLCFHFSMLPFL
jgi:hypothetical protein